MTAWDRARVLYKSKAHRRAYRDGANAARAGRSEASCPYATRTGFGASFRLAWLGGFASEKQTSVDDEA